MSSWEWNREYVSTRHTKILSQRVHLWQLQKPTYEDTTSPARHLVYYNSSQRPKMSDQQSTLEGGGGTDIFYRVL